VQTACGLSARHVSVSCGLLGASHTACLGQRPCKPPAAYTVFGLGIGCIHNQHLIILDQCAECDLLKFVQIQIRVKQWTQA